MRVYSKAVAGVAVLAAAGLPLLFTAAPAQATELTFNFGGSDGSIVPQGYGDHVTSLVDLPFLYGGTGGFTPNVVVSYGPAPLDVAFWTTDYGDLNGLLYRESDGAGILEITLTADPGFNVSLSSFDMAGWPNANYIIPSVQVLGPGASTLFQDNNALIKGTLPNPRHTSFVFGTPLTAQEVTIRFNSSSLNADETDNIGIDNIVFSQVEVGGAVAAPEPGALALAALGLPALVARVRRRRK